MEAKRLFQAKLDRSTECKLWGVQPVTGFALWPGLKWFSFSKEQVSVSKIALGMPEPLEGSFIFRAEKVGTLPQFA